MMRAAWQRPARHAATALAVAFLAAAHGQFPVEDMDRRSLGLGYSFALRGQNITDAEVGSHEVIHQIGLGYSPVPYISLYAGVGLDRFSVDPHQQTRFKGDYGFTSSFGVSGFSPVFAADLLRGTAGITVLTLGSEDDRGFRYSAFVTNPFLGLIVSPTRYLNATVGGRLHLIEGTMQDPRSAGTAPFGNSEIVRGYVSLTLKTPFERAFMNLDMDFSPALDSDWSNGPKEATVAVSFGTILGWKGKSQPTAEKPIYFPAYPEMKKLQDKMAEEIE